MDSASEGNVKQVSLKLGKCWQGNKPVIIWQVSPWGADKGQFPKKLYLVIECQQAKRGVFLQPQKPAQIKLGGGISAALRKHIPAGTVRELLVHKQDKHICIPIYQGTFETPFWFLLLSHSKPPEFSLVNAEGVALFRFGQKGTFTKRKESAYQLPSAEKHSEYENILEDLLKSSLLSQASMTEVEPEKTGNYHSDSGSDMQREAKQKLARRIKTVKRSFDKQAKGVPTQAEIDELSEKANLLQSYAYLVKPEQALLELDPDLTGLAQNLEIQLEPEWSVGKNVEEYFIRLKKRKKSMELGGKMLAKIAAELKEMDAALYKLKNGPTDDGEVLSILKKFKLQVDVQRSKDSPKIKIGEPAPYKTFKGLDDSEYLVGKGPSENDLLTKKAKSNDYWFHLVGGGGSHIVIPKRSLGRGGITPQIKREAAILAVHFSKVRQDRSGEVYVTQRRHLRKQKGLPIGLWLVDQSETYYVKYSESDLRLILDRS